MGLLTGKDRKLHQEYDPMSNACKVTKRPPQGESFVDLRKRVVKFWKKLQQYHGKQVLVVSHGAFIMQLIGHLTNKSVKESFLAENQRNTAVNIIEVDEDGKHKVHLVGCIKHL